MKQSPRIGIVGSGPAAAGVAAAWIEAGDRVTVLDVGQRPEAQAEEIKSRLSALPKEDWSPELIQAARGNYRCTPEGLEVKKQFGSDYSTRFPDRRVNISFEDVEHIPSFAFGGLSNIWGASILPYRAADIADWPLDAADLLPHYRAVAKLTGGTGEAGDPLDDIFPKLHEPLDPLPLSRSAGAMLQRLRSRRSKLQAQGIHCGMARLAVKTRACRVCGLCMHGCPDDLIYSSAQSFSEWIAQGKVDYHAGQIVRRFRESPNGVVVETTTGGTFEFDRLFVAAGVIPTTGIVLSSLEAYDQPVIGKDSHYFLFPLLRFTSSGNVRIEALQTLSQIFLDWTDDAHGGKTTHAQLYSYSDIIDASVRAMLGPLAGLAPFVLSRLLIAQVFLHSDLSASLVYTLRRSTDGTETLHVASKKNPATDAARQRVLSRFLSLAGELGAVAGVPFVKVGTPGRGLHCGSTFPMTRDPKGNQTDLLGRLPGFSRVHLADSSVLPSIPGTTIAFSSMANAHRIASEAIHLAR